MWDNIKVVLFMVFVIYPIADFIVTALTDGE